jgi:ribosomal protein S12 methylthiotransferase accessory factor
MTAKGYTTGTHRLVDPVDTLERIRPHLSEHGITRCADVTGLDNVGIPVYCAIRPAGRTVQVTNGKGVRHVDAQVSALMEALEVSHAESPPPDRLLRASAHELRRARAGQVLDPDALTGFRTDAHYSPDYQIDWVRGQQLPGGESIWVPASSVYLCWPALYEFSSRGLASGNDRDEATLHALYEALEHDAIGRLNVAGTLSIEGSCEVIDLASVDDPNLTGLIAAIEHAGLTLVLLTVPTHGEATTIWAATLDPRPLANPTIINFGFGAHLSPSIAASRAITEAAQARLTFIHGSREDLTDELYASATTQNRLRDFFAQLRPSRRWPELADRSTPSLSEDLGLLLASLTAQGFHRILRVDLTRAPSHIPVVKVLVPGLRPTPF